ncbi:MAG: phosphoglycerate kinase [Candidatus Marsarchaeota archaeon]|nr:phosphoglycerate kinase [Candidatus Marsarchaeota archaeon]
MDYYTLEDLPLQEKTVILRLDINSPLENGMIQSTERIESSVETIKYLKSKNCKTIIIAHQGRPGDEDFIPMEQHAHKLSESCGFNIEFIDDNIGKYARERIKIMKKGETILLQNIRFLAEETLDLTPEEHSKSIMIKTLSPLAQLFINDAYSASHRNHCSITGFTQTLQSGAGIQMQKEIEGNSKIHGGASPVVYVLGGAKPEDDVKLMKYALEKELVNAVLLGGVMAVLYAKTKGWTLSEKEDEEIKKWEKPLQILKQLQQEYPEIIAGPIDYAVKINGKRAEVKKNSETQGNPIEDIGTETAKKYAEIIQLGKTIYLKGPMGRIEEEQFRTGTEIVLKSFEQAKAFTLTGGGHIIEAMDMFKIDKSKISHISLAGGALLDFMSGEKLPGVEALKENKKRFPK